MKLREYLIGIATMVRDNPEILDMEVIAAIDDEGNGYNVVNYTPSVGMFINNEEFYDEKTEYEDCYEDNEDNEDPDWKPNSICIN